VPWQPNDETIDNPIQRNLKESALTEANFCHVLEDAIRKANSSKGFLSSLLYGWNQRRHVRPESTANQEDFRGDRFEPEICRLA